MGLPKRFLLKVFMIFLILGLVDLPHLRITYKYVGSRDNPLVTEGQYLGPFGMREVSYSDFNEGCPIVLFIPFDSTTLENIQRLAHRAMSESRTFLGTVYESLRRLG